MLSYRVVQNVLCSPQIQRIVHAVLPNRQNWTMHQTFHHSERRILPRSLTDRPHRRVEEIVPRLQVAESYYHSKFAEIKND